MLRKNETKNDIQYLDSKVWRCRAKNPKNDIQCNIRANSILEYFNVHIIYILFLIFEGFALNIRVNKSLINLKDLCSQLGKQTTAK